ncbi:glycosyltransferase family 61 protein [Paracoccus shanxieyensis]|uniref:DUF563 domain-containing protein n=1 Tax=Paracoccus shanxieyensis TaxID=2675752 RepID=A0A6L6IYY4_9RHOB|nr:glycosyltransferase family 61 protein [Paracoccus shanxieyensis]MTH63557.1 DUF563 domain-containing protein [Paracoccus shanxieyensis]MTH86478.1 DUF563 domain-containing protein [Paracoccus shanxieyensis]
MKSLRPLTYRLGLLLGLGAGDLAAASAETWEVAPAETRPVPPAILLPDQIDRIRQTEFTTLPLLVKSLEGDPAEAVGATRAYLLTDVDIVDGVLYSHGLSLHLRSRRHKLAFGQMQDMGRGALYETWVGNRWFGNWLLDDCLSYRLAETAGQPVTTMPKRGGHMPRYEDLLGVAPTRLADAHFDELLIFEDHANNSHRLKRAQDMRDRLIPRAAGLEKPGVFLLRGNSGDLRHLTNETQIAERMARDFGFRVMFPEDHSVEELMTACCDARVIAGVEGSQLNHGVAAMPPGGTLLTIQPPDRATTAMKLMTDRWQQRFAMVVAQGSAQAFTADWDDIARTLDLVESKVSENSS